MARPRTATVLLDARGSFKNHSERGKARAKEPKVKEPMPKNPPKHLTDEQKAAWREVVKCVPAGVLTAADAIIVEIVACLLQEWREQQGKMPTHRITRLTSEMAKIGLSPSARASLSVDAEDDDDDF